MFRESLAGIVALLLILSLVATPTAGVSDQADTAIGTASPASSTVSDRWLHSLAQVPTNNSTSRHENPEEARADGDMAALESHLAQRLSRSLGDDSEKDERQPAGDGRPCATRGSHGP